MDMDEGLSNGRIRPKRHTVKFPAAEPDLRAARLRCARACNQYNDQAEFASPEMRARLWKEIVSPGSVDLQVNDSKENSRVQIHQTSHKVAKVDPGLRLTHDEATREPHASDSGHRLGDAQTPHSLTSMDHEQALQASQRPSMVRSVSTPPSSPDRVIKDGLSETIAVNGDDAVDNLTIADTPPLSRQTSAQALSNGTTVHDSTSDRREHDPAVTNPFIVQAPYVKPPVFIDYGTNLRIGNGTFINRNLVVIDSPVCHIKVGERCMFGPNVILAAVEHPLDASERISPIGAPSIASNIEVGDDCWIAAGVKILCGVKIGGGCVIGAGSVVTKDVPDGCIAYGNPARVARVCSPKYAHRNGPFPSALSDFSNLPIFSPTEITQTKDDLLQNRTSLCNRGCSMRPAETAPPRSSVMQRGKDTVLILIGLASLMHFIRSF